VYRRKGLPYTGLFRFGLLILGLGDMLCSFHDIFQAVTLSKDNLSTANLSKDNLNNFRMDNLSKDNLSNDNLRKHNRKAVFQ